MHAPLGAMLLVTVALASHHMVFDCPALQPIRDNYAGLFHVTTMQQVMWQTDIVGVAHFIKDCFAHVQEPVVDALSDDGSI